MSHSSGHRHAWSWGTDQSPSKVWPVGKVLSQPHLTQTPLENLLREEPAFRRWPREAQLGRVDLSGMPTRAGARTAPAREADINSVLNWVVCCTQAISFFNEMGVSL